MLFLVDYGNIGNMGMKGCHYLNEADRVIIFYSDARRHMERRYLEDIANVGCIFEICKLYKSGKNALDFYITSKLGELFGGGFDGTEYEEMTGEIQKLIEEKKKTPKVIYLNCLHSFGRDNGLAIYNRMKACGEL